MAKAVLQNQYVAARVYFGAVVALVAFDGLWRLLQLLFSKHRDMRKKHRSHWPPTVFAHKALMRSLPTPILRKYHGADAARFLIFAAVNVIFGLNKNEFTTDFKLYGWLTISNGGLGLLFAARTNLFSVLLRIPSPVVLQYHKLTGLATIAHATTHVSLNLRHFITTDQVDSNAKSPRIRAGFLAWASLVIIFLTTLRIIRRRLFEVFYFSHFLFLVFVAGALYHTTKGPEFLLPGLSLWAVDRAIRFLYNFRGVRVQNVKYYSGDLTKIQVSGIRRATPGQMIWIQMPKVSRFNWHPFTVANVEASKDDGPGPISTLAIRGLGGYTKALQRIAGVTDDNSTNDQFLQPKVRLDGPYGVGRLGWSRQKVILLVAGGVGITPGLSIASYVIQTAVNGRRETHDTRHVHLLWSVKKACHIEWFAEELRALHDLSCKDGSTVTFTVTIHISEGKDTAEFVESKPESTDLPSNEPWRVESGRPDICAWFKLVQAAVPNTDAAVSVCGPTSLQYSVRQACVSMSESTGLFFLEEESFEL